MDRKAYWNEKYVAYWKDKVAESNGEIETQVTQGDSPTGDDEDAQIFFRHTSYRPGDKLLDFGCGFGRFYEFFHSLGQEYYGIDISTAMIDEARRRYPEISNRLFVTEGEHLPFDDGHFKKVICYGVFDACYQEEALSEMLRVCAPGGGNPFVWEEHKLFSE